MAASSVAAAFGGDAAHVADLAHPLKRLRWRLDLTSAGFNPEANSIMAISRPIQAVFCLGWARGVIVGSPLAAHMCFTEEAAAAAMNDAGLAMLATGAMRLGRTAAMFCLCAMIAADMRGGSARSRHGAP